MVFKSDSTRKIKCVGVIRFSVDFGMEKKFLAKSSKSLLFELNIFVTTQRAEIFPEFELLSQF